ncbi:MAG: hypothetical protein M0027_12725 [Candidatus Dormibacteraeota bacterium]|jgi:hypothetical protein|nr:hypothetical protein [Candidatus Dormibacteraeota bacterium]
MLSRRAVAAVLAAGIALSAVGLLASPVLAADPPACTSITACSSNTATVTAFDAIPGPTPKAGAGSGGGGTIGTISKAICAGPFFVGEAVGVGAGGQLAWTDPFGHEHLVGLHGGGLGFGVPPIAEYYILANYSRTGQVTPATTTTPATCDYSPWVPDGFSFVPVTKWSVVWSQLTPAVNGLEALVTQKLRGGTVASLPARDALVDLATNYVVANSNVPELLLKSTTVTSGPIASAGGRSLVLTVAVAIQRVGVTWDFGDGRSQFDASPGAMGTPGPNSTVQFTYYDVSVHGEHPTPYPVITPKDQIPVTATQDLWVSAVAIWRDAQGRHEKSLGSYWLHLPVAPHWIVVGQIESIPVCPTKTNCS